MPTLLHVDSSPLGEASLTRNLSSEFVRSWRQAHPDGEVIARDLSATVFPVIDAAWIGAAITPEAQLTAAQRELLALSETLIGELQRADEWVFGVPMHNFTIPATLRLWLDQVVRAGKTFSYASGAPQGLLQGKKVHFLLASGGQYGPGSPAAAMNFVEPYLRMIFGFLGVTDVSVLQAGGASAVSSGKTDRQSFLAPHLDAIRSEFQAA